MFCPRCGQQQSTEEMRFCSRCGFRLEVVTALIASDGAPPAVIFASDKGVSTQAAKRNKRRGAKLMFLSGVVFPFAMALSIAVDSPLPFVIPFTIFLAGLALMLYIRWFSEDESIENRQGFQTQLGDAKQTYFPPSQPPNAAGINRTPHSTAEIVQPRSITEHTTKLLDADADRI